MNLSNKHKLSETERRYPSVMVDVGAYRRTTTPYGDIPVEVARPVPYLRSGTAHDERLRVSVLVNLFWHDKTGGHVKCWERFAEAVAQLADRIDLTVHFSGESDGCHELAANVRYRLWRPVFPTTWLPFLNVVPDHTDLAPFHPRLAQELANQDVIHTTDAFFSFAGTARVVTRRTSIPLVHSTHTDTPNYTRVFSARVIERVFGADRLGRFLIDGIGIPERLRRTMQRKLDRHHRQAAFSLVSSPSDRVEAERVKPASRVSTLGRGIDFSMFDPGRADRDRLARRYGVPHGDFLIAFAGRLNRGKNIGLLMQALDRDWMAPHDAHLFLAGDGEDRAALARHFGSFATCPGNIGQDDLACVYTAADVMAFPSMIEVTSNVVREAMASGTCVLAPNEAGVSDDVADGTTGLRLSGRDPAAWRHALTALARRPAWTAGMGAAAHEWARRSLRSWKDVLADDLLPVWYDATRRKRSS